MREQRLRIQSRITRWTAFTVFGLEVFFETCAPVLPCVVMAALAGAAANLTVSGYFLFKDYRCWRRWRSELLAQPG